MCIDIAIFIAGKIGRNIIGPIWIELSYVKDYEDNIEKFKNHFESLRSATTLLQQLLDKAKRIEQVIPIDNDQMERWQTRVDAINEGARVFFVNEARANDGCFYGLCPNLMSLYSLNKLAKEKTQVITELQDEFEKFKKVLSSGPIVGAIQSIAIGISKDFKFKMPNF